VARKYAGVLARGLRPRVLPPSSSFPRSAWERQGDAPRRGGNTTPTQSVGARTEELPTRGGTPWHENTPVCSRGVCDPACFPFPPRSHAPRGNARGTLRVVGAIPRPRRAWARERKPVRCS